MAMETADPAGRKMRSLVYYVATTLDGYIARPDGSFDEFPWDEDYIAALMELFPETFPAPFRRAHHGTDENRRFGAVLMGRRTYQVGLEQGLTSPYPTLDQYVFSRTMESSPDPAVTLISKDAAETVARLKNEDGKDIWLCGGGALASTLFDAKLIDELILKLNPVVFGTGTPLFAHRVKGQMLELTEVERYLSGHVRLHYRVGA
jgi:dihydrofolate reductase